MTYINKSQNYSYTSYEHSNTIINKRNQEYNAPKKKTPNNSYFPSFNEETPKEVIVNTASDDYAATIDAPNLVNNTIAATGKDDQTEAMATPNAEAAYVDVDNPTPLANAVNQSCPSVFAAALRRWWTHLRLGALKLIKYILAVLYRAKESELFAPSSVAPATDAVAEELSEIVSPSTESSLGSPSLAAETDAFSEALSASGFTEEE